MEKINFKNYKIKVSNKKTIKIQGWQEYALQVIKDFNINKPYSLIIFRQAKKNIEFLKGRVENTKERFNNKVEDKGRYLLSLFRKKKPWDI
jgi:peptidoglycan hydrolase-like protein with peptidoglycan-binding domain